METKKNHKLSTDESLFVRGPLSRFKELTFAFKVFFNFINAFRKMHFIGPCVTVFGSARFTQNSEHYKNAEKIGAVLWRQLTKALLKLEDILLDVILSYPLNRNQIPISING